MPLVEQELLTPSISVFVEFFCTALVCSSFWHFSPLLLHKISSQLHLLKKTSKFKDKCIITFFSVQQEKLCIPIRDRVHGGRDGMVIEFTTITTKVVSSNPIHVMPTRYIIMWYSLSVTCDRSVVFSIHHYVIQFVIDLCQVSGFLRVSQFPPPIKLERHNITEILLKVALNTINPNPIRDIENYL